MPVTRPLATAVLLILTGCSAAQQVARQDCPKTSVLDGTSTLTRFREGPGRDLIDVNFSSEVESLDGSCLYETNDAGAGILNMEARIGIKAERGPANRDRIASFKYFVAVVDAGGKVLNKKVFPLKIEFRDNQTTAVETDAPVTLDIPLAAGQGGGDFRVYFGFQLSADEIRYNRDKAGGGNS